MTVQGRLAPGGVQGQSPCPPEATFARAACARVGNLTYPRSRPSQHFILEPLVTYVVIENCIRCKYMDCVEVCPVDCFYVGENMLVINPDECIDCGVCEPECPAEAIIPDSDDKAAAWLEQNRTFSTQWPNITRKGQPPADADEWKDKPGKAALFSPEPGQP
jgi:ferredoxin